MTLVESLRAMVTRRAQIVAELAAIDQDLAAARSVFAEFDTPAAEEALAPALTEPITRTCEVCRQPFAQRSNRQKMCAECRVKSGNRSTDEIARTEPGVPGKGWKTIPCAGCGKPIQSNGPKKRCPDCQLAFRRTTLEEKARIKRAEANINEAANRQLRDRLESTVPGDATCERCGVRFTKKAGTAGRFCSRACYEQTAPGEERCVLEERRCVNRRCLIKFKPRDDQQVECASCEQKDKPTSWHAKATKQDEKFETVWNGGEGLSGVGSQKGRES